MPNEPQFSEEARSDGDQEEDEALSGPVTDPGTIESRVAEGLDGNVVVYPPDPHHGSLPHDDVDGTDAEAVFEDENREVNQLEEDLETEMNGPPDLVDLHDNHAEGDGGPNVG